MSMYAIAGILLVALTVVLAVIGEKISKRVRYETQGSSTYLVRGIQYSLQRMLVLLWLGCLIGYVTIGVIAFDSMRTKEFLWWIAGFCLMVPSLGILVTTASVSFRPAKANS